jgi:hypothetical protein
MSDKEVESFWRFIKHSMERILACTEGLDEEDLNWRPLNNANSLYVLATHTMANLEENILGVLAGRKALRNRNEDFKVKGSSIAPVKQSWRESQERVSSYLKELTVADLNKEYQHPRRGKITGWEILMAVSRHASEHVGHAELTRDLLFTARGRALPVREY